MTWPQDPPLTKTHLDEDGDNPLLAREEIEELLDRMNLILLEAADGSTLATSDNLATLQIAVKNLANVFTAIQTIQGNLTSLLNLNTTNASEGKDLINFQRAGADLWKFRLFSNNGLGIYRSSDIILDMAYNCKRLFLAENDITYDGKSLLTQTFPSNPASNGYIDLPGGITMEWGYKTNNDNLATVTWPKAFSATPWCINANAYKPDTQDGAAKSIAIETRSATSCRFSVDNENFYWQAIGST